MQGSKDKPWLIFVSPHQQIGTGACIAQTIGNRLGSALLWCLADDQKISKLDVFWTPETPGFGGRQAFAKGNDLFYSAVQSVTGAAISSVSKYDRSDRLAGKVPAAYPVDSGKSIPSVGGWGAHAR